jgi:hypothetical protein
MLAEKQENRCCNKLQTMVAGPIVALFSKVIMNHCMSVVTPAGCVQAEHCEEC